MTRRSTEPRTQLQDAIMRWRLDTRSYQQTTQNQHGRALLRFEAFCAERGFASQPAASETVAAFLSLRRSGGAGAHTVKGDSAAISIGHQLLGLPDPTEGHVVRSVIDARRTNSCSDRYRDKADALLNPSVPLNSFTSDVAQPNAQLTSSSEISDSSAVAALTAEPRTAAGDSAPSSISGLPALLAPNGLLELDRREKMLISLDRAAEQLEARSIKYRTWLTYRDRLVVFLAFCDACGLVAYPCSVDTAARFFVWYAVDGGDGDGRSPSTMQVAKAALRWVHELRQLPSPTSTNRIKRLLEGHRKSWRKLPRQARPLYTDEVRLILTRIDEVGGVVGMRDSAMVLLIYAACLRRSEGTTRAEHEWEPDAHDALLISDVEFHRFGMTLTLRRTKTDSNPLQRHISFGNDQFTCPCFAMDRWITVMRREGINDGPLFPRLSTKGDRLLGNATFHATALTPDSFVLRLKDYARASGLDAIDRISAHSLRRGHAHQAEENGADVMEIKDQGGWRNLDTVARYTNTARRQRKNSSSKLGL